MSYLHGRIGFNIYLFVYFMRLSPIIRKLLRPFLSRFFTKTLATASCSFTSAVFAFALLPAVHAEDAPTDAPAAEPLPSWEKTRKVKEAKDDENNNVPKNPAWTSRSRIDLMEYDTTMAIKDGWELEKPSQNDNKKSTLYGTWGKDANGNVTFGISNVAPEEGYEDKADVFKIKYQNIYEASLSNVFGYKWTSTESGLQVGHDGSKDGTKGRRDGVIPEGGYYDPARGEMQVWGS